MHAKMNYIASVSLLASSLAFGPTARAETPAEAFKAAWVEFANSFYDVSVAGKPKISASAGAMQRICFDLKVRPNAAAADKLVAALTKASTGDRPLNVGASVALGPSIDGSISERWGAEREYDLGDGRGSQTLIGMLDWSSEFSDEPGKVDLTLPGLREVVVRTDGKVIARVPVVASLQSKGKGLADPASLHVPQTPCSNPIDSAEIKPSTTARIEVIDLASILDQPPTIVAATDDFDF